MGPLSGVKIVELAGIGPGPFAGMLLSDMGADIVRVDRAQQVNPATFDKPNLEPMYRGRRSIGVDLKNPEGVELVLDLVEDADALIEGFRPGVTERLGLGPDVCLARNPRLAYGRLTGWGQDGPLAQSAGHDINYLALTGVLDAIGREGQPPTVPLNLAGDYAAGSLYLAVGLLAAILEARQSGCGQVVDAAIVDGAAHLATTFFGMVAGGISKRAAPSWRSTGSCRARRRRASRAACRPRPRRRSRSRPTTPTEACRPGGRARRSTRCAATASSTEPRIHGPAIHCRGARVSR